MGLSELRDLVIVILAVIGIVASLLFMSLVWVLYRKVSPILDSARSIFGDVRGTSSFVSDTIVKPIGKVAGLALGVRKTAEVLIWLFGRKGGKKHG